jgi:hypothetical protein
MGQMLSREDEDEPQSPHEPREQVEEVERPKRRQRNATAFRSRKPRASAQGRTRRRPPVSFE